MPDLLKRGADLVKATARFSKKKNMAEPIKALEAAQAGLSKAKLSKGKLEGPLKKMRDALRDVSKALKELIAVS